MKVLFAVSNEEISESIVKKYQKEYKEIISYKNVYYFNAILKEIQKDKTYDRIVISEELEAFTHTQYDQIDKFIFDKLDSISDEASNLRGDDTPIILICSDRRTKSEQMLVKLFGIGIYNAILGNDRSVEEVCRLIHKPRLKKEAKAYYKIDTEDVGYQSENENDVSEVEIQNILAHYKRLGKNEDKFVDSFNNIAAQYNDTQLRIISKFLPLNVRAVLEEKSSKYQQVMSFNNKVSGSLRKTGGNEKQEAKTSERLLKPKIKENIMTRPVVIPSSVDMSGAKKLTRNKVEDKENMAPFGQELQNTDIPNIKEDEFESFTPISTRIPGINAQIPNEIETVTQNIEEPIIEGLEEKEEQPEIVQTPKRRGRPRKNPIPTEQEIAQAPKRGRGRPRKNSVPESIEETSLPGFNTYFEEKEETILPGLQTEENILSGFESEKEEFVLPGLEPENHVMDKADIIRNNQQPKVEEAILPGLEETILPGFEEEIPSPIPTPTNNFARTNTIENNSYAPIQNPFFTENKQEPKEMANLEALLSADKKVACFVGTSKNGTSFMVNTMAKILSDRGVNVAILDTTKNRNSYYIYTKNEEVLRNVAFHSLENLMQGKAEGIQVNSNLTVYTSLPDERNLIEETQSILETLVKNYSVILIDCDFDTPIDYFANTQEIYLVQTLDVLTIQPLTAFLRELKAKNVLEENKLRVILNKVVKVRGINEKTIIGGMAFYNDPSMSFMTELFDRNLIKYIAIPFDEEVYSYYLEALINCDISVKRYPKNIMQSLEELANMIYRITTSNKGKSNYQPPAIGKTKGGFSPSMNSTLDQMKRNY